MFAAIGSAIRLIGLGIRYAPYAFEILRIFCELRKAMEKSERNRAALAVQEAKTDEEKRKALAHFNSLF